MSTSAAPTTWVLLHDLGRSGVPIVLERLLRGSGRGGDIHVLAIHGGPMQSRLADLARTCTVLEPDGRRSVGNALAVGVAELGAVRLSTSVQRVSWRLRLRHLPDPDVVLVHGAGGIPLLGSVPGDPPVVVHLHELATGLDRSVGRAMQRQVLGRAERVLAVSRPVAELAVERGARRSRVEVLPGVVEVPVGVFAASTGEGETGRVVMGAGAPGWRKATDRVAAVAHELARRGHANAVGWVGGAPAGQDARWVEAVDPVRWYGERDDPWTVMDTADVVLVPSREDPLPLVALEAGLRAKVVVATPTGGLPDLLGDGRGAVAPAHDVGWLARTTQRMLDDPDERSALGTALRAEVLAHHDAATVAPMWWSVLVEAAG